MDSLSKSLSSSQLRTRSGPGEEQPFTMETGQSGYVHEGTEEGDIICQFLNCDVAVVVRKTRVGYKILGRALIVKSASERNYVEAWALNGFSYSVLNAVLDFRRTLEQELSVAQRYDQEASSKAIDSSEKPKE